MSDVFPKFIVENGNIILGKVSFHKELITTSEKDVRGGGWYENINGRTILLYGESYDFGPAKLEDIQKAIDEKKVFGMKMFANYSKEYNFKYVHRDNAGEETLLFEPVIVENSKSESYE